jgi:hypothetical protein
MTMRQSSRILLVIATMLLGGGVGFVGGRADAKGKAKANGAVADGAKHEVNACGCYKDGTGACFCGKKGKCACPGDCEPKGCEEKRNKEIQKEVAAETKKAADADKKERAHEHTSHASKEPKPKKPSGVGQ